MTRYPWKLLPRLASEIEHARRDEARRDLDQLLAIIAGDERTNLTLCKLRCAQLVGGCLRGAHQGGASSDVILRDHLRFLERLSRLQSWCAIERAMRAYVDALIDHLQPLQRTNVERAVASIRDTIRASPATCPSLAQHAASLGLSTSHLSRSFSTMVGRPFREELRRSRMELARRLLTETRLKISVITERIGLRDPSQFIADFRAETGLTPGQFRSGRELPRPR